MALLSANLSALRGDGDHLILEIKPIWDYNINADSTEELLQAQVSIVAVAEEEVGLEGDMEQIKDEIRKIAYVVFWLSSCSFPPCFPNLICKSLFNRQNE